VRKRHSSSLPFGTLYQNLIGGSHGDADGTVPEGADEI